MKEPPCNNKLCLTCNRAAIAEVNRTSAILKGDLVVFTQPDCHVVWFRDTNVNHSSEVVGMITHMRPKKNSVLYDILVEQRLYTHFVRSTFVRLEDAEKHGLLQ